MGKSSLLLRFSDETWLSEDESSATIGVDFRVRVEVILRVCLYSVQVSKMEVRGKKVKLSIWVSFFCGRFWVCLVWVGYGWAGTVPDDYVVVLSWCTGYYTG